MEFDEVQVGDTVRTREVFEDGTVIDTEFTVEFVDAYDYVFGNDHTYARQHEASRKSLSIELVSRPAQPPKVGDLLTHEQIQALPNHAVFLGFLGMPRTVLGDKSYGPDTRDGMPLILHDSPGTDYRLIYLPDKENFK